jgi:hypothetical protein
MNEYDDEDILRWNFRETEDGVVTRLEVSGEPIWEFNQDSKAYFTAGMYEDPRLTRQFGQRVKQVMLGFLRTNTLCSDYAVAQMGFHAVHQHLGQE